MNSADKWLVACARVLTGLFVGAFAGFTAGTLLAIIVAPELDDILSPLLRPLVYGFRGALIGGWIGILVGWGRLQLRAVDTPWGQKEPGTAVDRAGRHAPLPSVDTPRGQKEPRTVPPLRRVRQPEPVEVEPQEDRSDMWPSTSNPKRVKAEPQMWRQCAKCGTWIPPHKLVAGAHEHICIACRRGKA